MRTGLKTLYWKVTGTKPKGKPTPSETSKCRSRLAPFCVGYGLDIGPGGDPIVPGAVRVDLPNPYSHVGAMPVQLGGDATDLKWFKDGMLDYVYSSHVLEDFHDTAAVLREWLRVLKPGGKLVIFCPDEQVYRGHCKQTGQPYNTCHIHADFSLDFVKKHLQQLGGTKIVHEDPLVDIYSWEIVIEKLQVANGHVNGHSLNGNGHALNGNGHGNGHSNGHKRV